MVLIQRYQQANPTKRTIDWKIIAQQMGPGFKPKQLRQKCFDIRKSFTRRPFTKEEDMRLIEKVQEYGERWDLIQLLFLRRPPQILKQRYYYLKKQMMLSQEDEENLVIEPFPIPKINHDRSPDVNEDESDTVSETSEYYSDENGPNGSMSETNEEEEIRKPEPQLFTTVIADVPPTPRRQPIIAFGLFEPPRIGFW